MMAGAHIGIVLSSVMLCSVAYVIWIFREDLPFMVAYSIAAFSLVIPFQIYNDILLLAPITWLFMNRGQFESWSSRLLIASVTISLCMGWLSVMAISFLYLVNRQAALFVWTVPFSLTLLLPVPVFLTLGYHAFFGKHRKFQPSH
jgi:hypothetical protein